MPSEPVMKPEEKPTPSEPVMKVEEKPMATKSEEKSDEKECNNKVKDMPMKDAKNTTSMTSSMPEKQSNMSAMKQTNSKEMMKIRILLRRKRIVLPM